MRESDHVAENLRFLGHLLRAQSHHHERSADLSFEAPSVLLHGDVDCTNFDFAVTHVSSRRPRASFSRMAIRRATWERPRPEPGRRCDAPRSSRAARAPRLVRIPDRRLERGQTWFKSDHPATVRRSTKAAVATRRCTGPPTP